MSSQNFYKTEGYYNLIRFVYCVYKKCQAGIKINENYHINFVFNTILGTELFGYPNIETVIVRNIEIQTDASETSYLPDQLWTFWNEIFFLRNTFQVLLMNIPYYPVDPLKYS